VEWHSSREQKRNVEIAFWRDPKLLSDVLGGEMTGFCSITASRSEAVDSLAVDAATPITVAVALSYLYI